MPTPERVIETMRAECLDPTLIQRSAASRSNASDLRRALQPRAAPSRPRPHLTAGRSLGSGPVPGQHARCSPAGPARWTHPRVLRRRRVIESGFPTPTGGGRVTWATGSCRQSRTTSVLDRELAFVTVSPTHTAIGAPVRLAPDRRSAALERRGGE